MENKQHKTIGEVFEILKDFNDAKVTIVSDKQGVFTVCINDIRVFATEDIEHLEEFFTGFFFEH